ncbi:hypothetical protein G6M50_01535 [Agrobacterium rhizogenes]|uniref:Sulfurtransferase TusA family protein n=2 Tax=unclassified Rhizobium TaxID=2613769 RepID=A0AAU7SJ97_9HYPH|nr:hypothetical protein [Rhizobium rhizogenes]NTJ76473.1 hypothetical protein [Rhizobium rhizogenes]
MSDIRPVEFDWSDECIDEADLQAIVDAYLRSDRERKDALCAAAGIAYIADTRGLRCPFPVREMRSVLISMSYGDKIVLLTDDPVAKIDIPHAVMEDSNYLRVRIGIETAEVFLIEKS